MAIIYHILSAGNYTQDWSDPNLLTTAATWPDGPVIGYSGIDLTTSTNGADPQTLVSLGSAALSLNVNQTNPNTYSTGGVTEFTIANPTIAMQGSGSSDAPSIVFHVDATGRENVTFSFNARDLDGGADNTNQQIAVQYRIGDTGDFTNLPAGYILDASTGPNLATLVTPIFVTLPPDANNAAQVQIRVITTNAAGNDESIGIDDIIIASTAIPTDTTAPTLILSSPLDDATGVDASNNIILTFDEAVQMVTGGGAIEIRTTVGDTLIQSFTQADVGTSVTVSGSAITLNPTAILADLTNYYITIAANAVEDVLGNDFAGIASTTALSFTTAPPAPSLSVSVAPSSQSEGDAGTKTFTYTFTWANIVSDVSAIYAAIANGSVGNDAAEATDFQGSAFPSGTVLLTTGSGTATVDVIVNSDTEVEPDEHFTLAISPISGVAINTTNAPAIIANDDIPPSATVAINDVSISEGDSGTQLLTFTVTRSNADTAFTFDYTTQDGTALSASDYVLASSTGLSFAVGGALTQTISVTINGDAVVEPNETFNLVLSNITDTTGLTTFADATGVGTITNNDVLITRIYDIQGASHRSPFVTGTIGSVANSGAAVYSTDGVVTAIGSNGFYLQDETGDGNIATSDGIFVFTSSGPAASITVGERVRILNARVDEFRASGSTNDLTITQLNLSVSGAQVQEMNTTATLAPVIIGAAGRSPSQTSYSDAGFATFDPAVDALDFWESLEGMIVTIDNPIAISGTANFSGNEEIWLVADGAFNATSQNSNGGLTIAAGDQNPERIQIDDLITSLVFPDVTAGATFADITGVVNYNFGSYEVLVTASPTVLTPGILTAPEITTLQAAHRQLTIANYNFENLDPGDGAARFANFATQIVNTLLAPVVIAGQEIQDNNGATNNGETSASLTAQTLIDAITTAGGPTYGYVDIPPANGTAGGEPGGNIRPGFFYRTDLVQVVGTPTSLNAPAFDDSRDPLIVTFRLLASGVEFTLINNHFSSKGGDNGLSGNVQPPVLSSEVGRLAQAQALNDYIDTLLLANPNANIVVAGDLNDFGFSAPVQALIGGATPILTNLADALITNPADRYSYNFNGNSQELDHMLASANAFTVASAFDIVHVNADFGRLQLSDHDPSLALFDARQLSENLVGVEIAELLEGLGGNDTLNAGAGSDTIDGGEGNDIITFDLADTEANITGGNGTDSLYVVSPSGWAPTSFNLVAQGFEQAIVDQADTTGQSWSNFRFVYNTAWQVDYRIISFDNGSRWQQNFDELLNQTWRETRDVYTTTGLYDYQDVYFDSGARWFRNFDELSNKVWTELRDVYNTSNQFDYQDVYFDSGARWFRNFDEVGDQTYREQRDAYTAITNLYDYQDIYNKDGTRVLRDFDQDNAFAWAEHRITYDAAGVIIENIIL